eukprot:2045711-Pyramimonas_sp.AAC.1
MISSTRKGVERVPKECRSSVGRVSPRARARESPPISVLSWRSKFCLVIEAQVDCRAGRKGGIGKGG